MEKIREVGDVIKLAGNTSGHLFEKGDEVKITEVDALPEDVLYLCELVREEGGSRDSWWVSEKDIAPAAK